MTLQPFGDDVWTAAVPHTFYGLHLGTRMTVVRLSDKQLLIHSPIPVDETLKRELDALGPVGHIVCPNLFHHVYAGDMARAYPEARLYGPSGLARKRRDLKLSATLDDASHAWSKDLVPVKIEGSMLRETVFVHPRSRSVISADLAENFATSDHWPTRLYLRAAGIHGKVGWSRLLRVVYRDRGAARRSIDQLLEHDFDRLVIAHGSLIDHGAKEAVRTTFSWLS